MTSDEIMHVLRLTAMSRAGHPLQQELADKLAAVFARPECKCPAELAAPEVTDKPKRKKAD